MEPGILDLEIYRGQAWVKELKRYKDEALKEPFDWTGWTIEWILGGTITLKLGEPKLVVVEKITIKAELAEADTLKAVADHRDRHQMRIISPTGQPDFLLHGWLTWRNP